MHNINTTPSRSVAARTLAGTAVASVALTAIIAGSQGASAGSGSTALPTENAQTIRLSGVKSQNAQATASLFKGQGLPTKGVPEKAITWADAGGVNFLLTTKETDVEDEEERRIASPVSHNGVLRVYQITGIGSRNEKVGQLLSETNDIANTEPDESGAEYDYTTCTLDGGIGFTPNSVTVTDADRNGFGEVSVGWWQQCAGDVSPARVHLATFAEGQTLTLNGEGSSRNPTAAEKEARIFPDADLEDIPAVKAGPTPKAAAWPTAILTSATALFNRLYR